MRRDGQSATQPHCLSDLINARPDARRAIHFKGQSVPFAALAAGDCLEGDPLRLAGRNGVLVLANQLQVAAALFALDGWARRIVISPPDLERKHLAAVLRDAEADFVVFDGEGAPPPNLEAPLLVPCRPHRHANAARPDRNTPTEWVLLTSGTTGDPKMVAHSFATLTHAVPQPSAAAEVENWATFYDIRRYGGLQIFLRGCAGAGSLTLRGADESADSFLARAGAAGVTHISGTPAHWRLVLMNAARDRIHPKCVRLSGEIADDSLIRALSGCYPQAQVVHAYASTEAGVIFEIDDGQAGFPQRLLEASPNDVALKLVDGSLRVKSPGTALRFVGAQAAALHDDDGFVDTGDAIRLTGDRCHFAGRRGGVINIGGAKVHPEEIEAIINQHPGVHSSLAKGLRNPITGSIVVADVVLKPDVAATPALKDEIISACARELAPYKVPALICFVASLAVTATGKLART